MKIMKSTKKIIRLFIFIFIFTFLTSCSTVSMNINRDGSGEATILIAKQYQDENGNTVNVTKDDVDNKLNDIVLAA